MVYNTSSFGRYTTGFTAKNRNIPQMKLFSFFFGCFSVVSGVSTPITEAGLKHYMAARMSLRVQRLQMRNGYHRNRRPNRYQGRGISPKDLIKQIRRAQMAERQLAEMKIITNKYIN